MPHVHNHVVKHDVFRDGQRGDQRHIDLLINDLDAKRLCGGRLAQLYHLAVIQHVSGVIRV